MTSFKTDSGGDLFSYDYCFCFAIVIVLVIVKYLQPNIFES